MQAFLMSETTRSLELDPVSNLTSDGLHHPPTADDSSWGRTFVIFVSCDGKHKSSDDEYVWLCEIVGFF